MKILCLNKKTMSALLLGVGATLFYACLNPVGNGKSPDGGLLSANGDYIPAATADTSYFATKVQPIFVSNKCTQCHVLGGPGYTATGGTNGGLDLTLGKSFSSLVGVPTFEAATTAPLLRVKPGDTTGSYLYQKVTSATPKSGARMPLGYPVLSAEDINTIKKWIQDGAKQ